MTSATGVNGDCWFNMGRVVDCCSFVSHKWTAALSFHMGVALPLFVTSSMTEAKVVDCLERCIDTVRRSVDLAVDLVFHLHPKAAKAKTDVRYPFGLQRVSDIRRRMSSFSGSKKNKVVVEEEEDRVIRRQCQREHGVANDGLFLSSHSFLVDESSLTGESDHVEIEPSRSPFLLSSVKLVDGYAQMLVKSEPTQHWVK
ncbi:Calcium-transporting ATPase [Vigna angularis]|uniref:Calcium-transporting ATPase n=1 Tax=Phaseolus angularis TaxID=3914 RepID=A0A8T0K3J9_PHAAN|nr:Calcium-transporting ATPase [Vigna angularis]